MFQIIVLEDGTPRTKLTCDAYVIGTVDTHSDRCLTNKAGHLGLCTFATAALFGEMIGVLQNHLEPRPTPPGT